MQIQISCLHVWAPTRGAFLVFNQSLHLNHIKHQTLSHMIKRPLDAFKLFNIT